jgi:hypothetical protein
MSMVDSANLESAPGFDNLEQLPTVCDLPIFDDAGTIEKFVKLSFWFLMDYSGFHLRWFLLPSDGRPRWDDIVSRQGKAALALAVGRLETCLVVLLSVAFVGCLTSIQKIVSTEYSHFSDGYLRHYLEAMIARWSSDVHASTRPSVEAYKDWSMKDAGACAALLKRYAEDFMLRAEQGWRSNERHLAPFTAHPHSLFFNNQGPFYNMKNQEGQVWESPEPQVHNKEALSGIGPPGGGGPSRPGAHQPFQAQPPRPAVAPPAGAPAVGVKRHVERTHHCMWAMAGIMGICTRDGIRYGCNVGTRCPSVHEATDAADVARLLTKDDFQSWKTSTRVKSDMAASIPNFDASWL